MGRSRGGLSTKIHTLVDAAGLPIGLFLTPGQASDAHGAQTLLNDLRRGTVVLADKGYDADWVRAKIEAQGAAARISDKPHREHHHGFSKILYKERNKVERFFNKIKQCRRVATHYEKLGANFLSMVKLAAVRIRIRSIEPTA